MLLPAILIFALVGETAAQDNSTGQVLSECATGAGVPTANRCPPGYTCFNRYCYIQHGDCTSAACATTYVCVDDSCIDLRTSTTSNTTTTTTAATKTTTTSAGGAGECLDLAAPGKPSDCPHLAYLCDDPNYYDLMTKQCPKTCNRCPGGTGGSTCVDLAAPGKPSDCPNLAYLCDDPNYYDLMTKQCPKTCNRCPAA